MPKNEIDNVMHAYLIIAHNEFEILKYLIDALDDPRNDIFIHIDKKVKALPELTAKFSNIYILEERFDVRWGHSSLVKLELYLLHKAFKRYKYTYCHIISGVHMPLFSQDYLHDFFNRKPYHDYLMMMPTNEQEIGLKMKRYHFFIKCFLHRIPLLKQLDQYCWLAMIRMQRLLKITRNRGISFVKASQWVSLSSDSVTYLLENKKKILRRYQYTFCADEFFIASELSQQENNMLFDCRNLLKCDFVGISPREYAVNDFKEIMESGCFFARKFSAKDLAVVNMILENFKKRK